MKENNKPELRNRKSKSKKIPSETNFEKCKREVGDGAPAEPEEIELNVDQKEKFNKSQNYEIGKDSKTLESQSQNNELVKQTQFQYLHVHLDIDLISSFLFITTLATRLYRLTEPKSIVFDELHYGRYVSLYLKGIFFFDSHPPLGKQLIFGAANFVGYNGNFTFDKIGRHYDDTVPIFAMRLIPAVCGSLIAPLVYTLMLELGLKQWTAMLAGLLILFENAFLTQSRFILMESILLMFALLGLVCILKFIKFHDRPYCFQWWFWLTSGAFFMGCSFSVKYVGFYSYILAVYLIFREFWQLVGRKDLSNKIITFHFIWRALTFVVVPFMLYVGVFYFHLSALTKAGPHDSVMTSAFQASLEGGLASITKGQPTVVAHGSQITLRHTHGRMCWLHSHAHVYPVKYQDKRGSSHQQQVTCYSFKDVNNWWIVKRPDVNDLVVGEPIDAIRHGDRIQLVHGISSRALNSHDVAAPVSPHSQEVSCYIDYNISMPAQNIWVVDIVNRESEDTIWSAIQSLVHLVHLDSGMSLKFSGQQLPDWGFHQHEVVADKNKYHPDTVWNVEEHRYTKTDDKKERERDLVAAEMIPTAPTKLSFWQKFLELQYKILFANQDSVQNHMFSSEPLEWPLLTRGIAYWVSSDSNAQIHLIGNMVIWWTATYSVIIYFSLLFFYLIRRQRKCYDITEEDWTKFKDCGSVLVVGYFAHYLPYFFVERTLFLHHYLPAYLFKILILSYMIEHIYTLLKLNTKYRTLELIFLALVCVWLVYVAATFKKFSVLNYGTTDLNENDLINLRWRDTWDFILHKKK